MRTGTVDPDMAVSIEHEDTELDQLEGLRHAAHTPIEAKEQAGMWPGLHGSHQPHISQDPSLGCSVTRMR